MNNTNTKDYNTIYDESLSFLTQRDNLNKFEKNALLFHCILSKESVNSSSNIQIQGNQAIFLYTAPSLILSLKLVDEGEKIGIESVDYKDGKTKLKIAKDNKALTNVNFNNLNGSLTQLEKYVKENLMPVVPKEQFENINAINGYEKDQSRNETLFDGGFRNNFSTGSVNSGNQTFGTGFGQPLPSSGFTGPNPYFTSEGVYGGNLVGPSSDIFRIQGQGRSQFGPFGTYDPLLGISPNLSGGVNNPYGIRYDPIGPFGTFGGVDDPDAAMFSNYPEFNDKKFLKGEKKKNPFDF